LPFLGTARLFVGCPAGQGPDVFLGQETPEVIQELFEFRRYLLLAAFSSNSAG
jgi:hypothetical protein